METPSLSDHTSGIDEIVTGNNHDVKTDESPTVEQPSDKRRCYLQYIEICDGSGNYTFIFDFSAFVVCVYRAGSIHVEFADNRRGRQKGSRSRGRHIDKPY